MSTKWPERHEPVLHADRPLWVYFPTALQQGESTHALIWIETFHPDFPIVKELLVEIADASSRTAFMNEYRMTIESLRTAFVIGYSADGVASVLERWSKHPLQPEVIPWLQREFSCFGLAELVVESVASGRPAAPGQQPPQEAGYFVEAASPKALDDVLQRLPDSLRDLRTSYLSRPKERVKAITGLGAASGGRWRVRIDRFIDVPSLEDPSRKLQLLPTHEVLQASRFMRAQYPYRHADTSSTTVPLIGRFVRRRTVQLRDYQQRAISKVFRNGHARSGVIVLPCGAGKTPTGIAIACEIAQSTLVVVPDAVTRAQWRNQFLACTELDPEDVSFLGEDQYANVESNANAPVVIVTYQKLIAATESGGAQAQKTKEEQRVISTRQFGLMILDECHTACAPKSRMVIDKIVAARCVIGLTATLVREDEKITEVLFPVIGPRLYEANWLQLVDAGYLAAVQCVEIHCPMVRPFMKQMMDFAADAEGTARQHRQSILLSLSPVKLWVLQCLVRFHEARGDKILVFVEKPVVAKLLARWVLNCPFVAGTGDTNVSEIERLGVINHFRYHPDIRTVVSTRVLDCGVDVPDANVVIQLQFFGKSRVQEAQRLGRILRPKPRIPGLACNAFFYVLVTPDSAERDAAAQRQRFLQENSFEYLRCDASRILREAQVVFAPDAPPAVGWRRLERLSCTTHDEVRNLLDWIRQSHPKEPHPCDAWRNPITGIADGTATSHATTDKPQRVVRTAQQNEARKKVAKYTAVSEQRRAMGLLRDADHAAIRARQERMSRR